MVPEEHRPSKPITLREAYCRRMHDALWLAQASTLERWLHPIRWFLAKEHAYECLRCTAWQSWAKQMKRQNLDPYAAAEKLLAPDREYSRL